MTKRVHGRHGARWAALQGLYAWQLSGVSVSKIEIDLHDGTFHFEPDNPDNKVNITFDKEYLHELLTNISMQKGELDELILPHLDRPIVEVHAIEHAILWIAIYEFRTRIEIPYKVIINEAILLAKQFGAQDSHKFINGVLDKAAKVIREKEFAHS
ncbi:MAG: transcription antitermination factor NusB [Gammaproteobacteria bacterium]|jgi:N utilization substance protein B|nr:transcription antitermination factor NusB [Gammaproteobacteria bacterium]